jgi:hypothetical protein
VSMTLVISRPLRVELSEPRARHHVSDVFGEMRNCRSSPIHHFNAHLPPDGTVTKLTPVVWGTLPVALAIFARLPAPHYSLFLAPLGKPATN